MNSLFYIYILVSSTLRAHVHISLSIRMNGFFFFIGLKYTSSTHANVYVNCTSVEFKS